MRSNSHTCERDTCRILIRLRIQAHTRTTALTVYGHIIKQDWAGLVSARPPAAAQRFFFFLMEVSTVWGWRRFSCIRKFPTGFLTYYILWQKTSRLVIHGLILQTRLGQNLVRSITKHGRNEQTFIETVDTRWVSNHRAQQTCRKTAVKKKYHKTLIYGFPPENFSQGDDAETGGIYCTQTLKVHL